MQAKIIESQSCLRNIFERNTSSRVISKDGNTLTIRGLMDKVHQYRYALQDKKRILMCAENSFEWIAIFMTAMLYNKQLCAIDGNMDARLAENIIAEFSPEMVISERNLSGAVRLESLTQRIPIDVVRETEPSLVLYTTGTTGRPKGVVMGLKNILCNLLSFQNVMQIKETEVVALINPFSHSMGFMMMLLSICFGKESMILSNEIQTLAALSSQKIDVTAVPPIVLNVLQNKESYIENLKQCRMIISGGAGIQKKLFQKYKGYGIRLVNGYGMTECCPVVALSDVNQGNGELKPLNWCNIKVSDEGELCLKGDSLCTEYYGGEPIADEDGWFHTRDIVQLVDDGFVVLYRMDNVLVTESGFKINLEDLENRIAGIDEVCDSRAFICSGQEARKLGLEIVLEEQADASEKDAVLRKIQGVLHHYEKIDKLIFSEKVATIGAKKKRYESC